MHVLVTGGAGFIGSHLVERLLRDGRRVTSLDNFDPFYSPAAKHRNTQPQREHPRCSVVSGDIRDAAALRALPRDLDAIVHLAAKAGVRPSIEDPTAYYEVNVGGTQALLEFARERGIRHMVFASSSSVYGVNANLPWHEDDAVLRPISPYASTKVSGELLGHVYSHLYGIRFLALRFFTVYGPRQRPDLAIHKFARKMLAGEPIPVFGDGSTERDYTYIDDIVDGVCAAIDYSGSQHSIINLGNDRPISLTAMIAGLEEALGVKARIERLPEQPGDVPRTWASIERARTVLGYCPRTEYRSGVKQFAAWLREYTD